MKQFLTPGVLLLALLALLAPIQGDWLDGNDGVDRYGGNLPGTPTSMNSSSQPRDCALRCRSNPACKAWVFVKGNCGSSKDPMCQQKGAINPQSRNPCVVSGLGQEPALAPLKFVPFPVNSLHPTGWLKDVLQTQANGLSGHLPDFWAPVNGSMWMGGGSDGGLHEDMPYWLNGFLPLAYQLDNSSLTKTAERYVSQILADQLASGWLGPDDSSQSGNQYWSKYNIMNILRQYHEANPNDTRVVPAMLSFFKEMYRRMFDVSLTAPGSSQTWSSARWHDLALSIHWMLENHPSGQEQMFWDFAQLVHDQGFRWSDWYESQNGQTFPLDDVSSTNMYTHGVNNGMAIKSGAVWSRQSLNESDIAGSYMSMKVLDQYHGQANGLFGCDEHLAGSMPSRGSELCTVVEAMFSYEVMFNIIGDPYFSERAERLAYNALPATLTPDMWAHQYLQQVNQVQSRSLQDHIWEHDGPDSIVFGLAPNYPCCTANFNQGWPKFAQHVMSMLPEGDGVAVSMYAPATLTHTLPSGVRTTVTVTTNYPFEGSVAITADCGRGMRLSLRIPGWTPGPSVTMDGVVDPYGVPEPGSMYTVNCTSLTKVSLSFPMAITVERRYNDAASVYYGALLFALGLQDVDSVTQMYEYGSKDYNMTSTSPWNYGLFLPNQDYPEKYLSVTFKGVKPGTTPFSLEHSPLTISAKGKILDQWGFLLNAAAPPPPSPVESTNPMVNITFYPYGATNLRIGEMPVLMDEQ